MHLMIGTLAASIGLSSLPTVVTSPVGVAERGLSPASTLTFNFPESANAAMSLTSDGLSKIGSPYWTLSESCRVKRTSRSHARRGRAIVWVWWVRGRYNAVFCISPLLIISSFQREIYLPDFCSSGHPECTTFSGLHVPTLYTTPPQYPGYARNFSAITKVRLIR